MGAPLATFIPDTPTMDPTQPYDLHAGEPMVLYTIQYGTLLNGDGCVEQFVGLSMVADNGENTPYFVAGGCIHRLVDMSFMTPEVVMELARTLMGKCSGITIIRLDESGREIEKVVN